MFSAPVFSLSGHPSIAPLWINLNILNRGNIHQSLYRVGGCYLGSGNKKKVWVYYNNPRPPVSTGHVVVDTSIQVRKQSMVAMCPNPAGAYIAHLSDLHSTESSQSHFPHQPTGSVILPSICCLPVCTLAKTSFAGAGRRRCSRYINFHDRSSLKNKFSSLSRGE